MWHNIAASAIDGGDKIMQVLLLTADYANVSQDGKLNVLGIFNQVNAYNFPARHPSMYIVLQFIADIGETSTPRQVKVRLLDADANELGAGGGNFQFVEARGGPRPEANMILQINDLVFQKPGIYEFVVLVDNSNVAGRTIHVNQVDPPEG